MFTGIIQDLGTITFVSPQTQGVQMGIQTTLDPKHLQLGASIMCNGACMTVTDYNALRQEFRIDISPESLARTSMQDWKSGDSINLEPSLCAGDPLGGHIVTGHIDSVATVASLSQKGDFYDLEIQAPQSLLSFIAIKGSLAVDGCSLTVATLNDDKVGFAIIPHTWTHTVIHRYQPDTRVNIEIDILARYVARALGKI